MTKRDAEIRRLYDRIDEMDLEKLRIEVKEFYRQLTDTMPLKEIRVWVDSFKEKT